MRQPRRQEQSAVQRPLRPEGGCASALGYGPLTVYAGGEQSKPVESRAARAALSACVTGATGFVGGHVTRLLVERGDNVRFTYRDSSRIARLGDLAAEPVKADVLDRAAMRRAVRGCEVVFHSAG